MRSTKRKADKRELAKRRIQGARVAAGYTQAELAQVFGVSISCISKWENNIYAVDLGTAEKVCDFLEIDLISLIVE